MMNNSEKYERTQQGNLLVTIVMIMMLTVMLIKDLEIVGVLLHPDQKTLQHGHHCLRAGDEKYSGWIALKDLMFSNMVPSQIYEH